MYKNTVTIAAFAFKETNADCLLSVLTRQRMADGLFELPSEEICDTDADFKETIKRCLEKYNCNAGQSAIFPVGTYTQGNGDSKEFTFAYCVFVKDWPGPSFGTNWMTLSTEGSVSESLAGNHDLILSASKSALCNQLLISDDSILSNDVRMQLIDFMVSSPLIEAIARRLEEFGTEKVASSGLKDISSEKLIEELESRKRIVKKGKKEKDEQAHYVYNYWHAGQAVDIVVLAKDYHVTDKKGYVDLKIPLIKRASGVGAGWWGLPGGFIQKQDFIDAGWDGMQTDFDPKAFPKYRNALKERKRALRLSIKRILKDKTGIVLEDDAILYPLSVRDNPMRGTADGVPVIAETLLTVIDYSQFKNLSFTEDSNVGEVQWFTIKRYLYNENGEPLKEEGKPLKEENAIRISSDKRSPYDLRNNIDESDAFIKGSDLIVNFFKGKRPASSEQEKVCIPLFADHRDAIIDALQYVKEKTHTTTILADFLKEKDAERGFEFGEIKLVYESLVFPEETVRQNLHDMIVENSNKGNNGFLEKAPGQTRGMYVFNMEKFNEFLYRKVSIF